MTREEAIDQLQNCKELILQNGKDWLDERDIPLLDMAKEALSADGDLISRQDAIDAWWHDEVFFGNQREDMTKEQWLDYITEVINSLPSANRPTGWIPVSERLPKEHEWIGTKTFGTTISDKVLVTFDVDGTRFVKPLSLQNGKLSRPDVQTMDVFHKGWKMLAWMPLPEPYREDGKE